MNFLSAATAVPDLINAKHRIDRNLIELEGYKNMNKSFTSNDPAIREVAGKRWVCANKFKTKQAKYIVFGILLPVLIVFIYLIAYEKISQQYKDILDGFSPIIGLWIIIGVSTLIYNTNKWTEIQTTINTAEGPTLDNCEKLFSDM